MTTESAPETCIDPAAMGLGLPPAAMIAGQPSRATRWPGRGKSETTRIITPADIMGALDRFWSQIGRDHDGAWHLFRPRGPAWCGSSISVTVPADGVAVERLLHGEIPACMKCLMLAEANADLLGPIEEIGRLAKDLAASANLSLRLAPDSPGRTAERERIKTILATLTDLAGAL